MDIAKLTPTCIVLFKYAKILFKKAETQELICFVTFYSSDICWSNNWLCGCGSLHVILRLTQRSIHKGSDVLSNRGGAR